MLDGGSSGVDGELPFIERVRARQAAVSVQVRHLEKYQLVFCLWRERFTVFRPCRGLHP